VSFTYADAITGAHTVLNDVARARYTDANTFLYAQDAVREIAMLRPDLFVTTTNIACVAGTRQSLGADGLYVIDVIGVVGGRAVTKADLKTLARYNPNWQNDDAGECENWFPLYDDQTKRPQPQFIIYPPASVGQVLTVQHAYDPLATPPSAASETVPLPDQLKPAVEAYIVFRAESVDDEHVNSGRAAQFYTSFQTILGLSEKAKKTVIQEGRPQ
jgi:hypothetical protein